MCGSRIAVCYYALIRVERALVLPFVELTAVILVKKLIVGRFQPGPRTAWNHFQYWLMRTLLPDGNLCGVPRLVGNHCNALVVRAQAHSRGENAFEISLTARMLGCVCMQGGG